MHSTQNFFHHSAYLVKIWRRFQRIDAGNCSLKSDFPRPNRKRGENRTPPSTTKEKAKFKINQNKQAKGTADENNLIHLLSLFVFSGLVLEKKKQKKLWFLSLNHLERSWRELKPNLIKYRSMICTEIKKKKFRHR